jgi:hypothetical protein
LIAPPSLQFEKAYRVAPVPCGVVVAMVCALPTTQENAVVVVNTMPSTVKLAPGTLVPTVAFTVLGTRLMSKVVGPSCT